MKRASCNSRADKMHRLHGGGGGGGGPCHARRRIVHKNTQEAGYTALLFHAEDDAVDRISRTDRYSGSRSEGIGGPDTKYRRPRRPCMHGGEVIQSTDTNASFLIFCSYIIAEKRRERRRRGILSAPARKHHRRHLLYSCSPGVCGHYREGSERGVGDEQRAARSPPLMVAGGLSAPR